MVKSVANSASAPSGGSSFGPSAAVGWSVDREPALPEGPSPPRAPQAPARKTMMARTATADDERLILILLASSDLLFCMSVSPTISDVRHREDRPQPREVWGIESVFPQNPSLSHKLPSGYLLLPPTTQSPLSLRAYPFLRACGLVKPIDHLYGRLEGRASYTRWLKVVSMLENEPEGRERTESERQELTQRTPVHC